MMVWHTIWFLKNHTICLPKQLIWVRSGFAYRDKTVKENRRTNRLKYEMYLKKKLGLILQPPERDMNWSQGRLQSERSRQVYIKIFKDSFENIDKVESHRKRMVESCSEIEVV